MTTDALNIISIEAFTAHFHFHHAPWTIVSCSRLHR